MWDLFLVASVGFVGSFGHCVGMCGPLAIAFSCQSSLRPQELFLFHLWLNLGRLLSYGLLGISIGIAGELISAVGSDLRRCVSLLMGVFLLWLGILRLVPGYFPQLPLWQNQLHDRLQGWMQLFIGSPVVLGLAWGLIPCGFLYTAQLTAASANSWQDSFAIMASFGLGTIPAMVGIGISAHKLNSDHRAFLEKLGGWITLLIGILTLFRDEGVIDYSGYGAALCLLLALVARPLSGLWQGLLTYRRVLGVGAFFLSLVHALHIFSHSFQWQWQALQFLLPIHRQGILAALLAITLLFPLALTSTDAMVRKLGSWWRRLHLFSLPAFGLVTIHIVCSGSHFLGGISGVGAYYRSVGVVLIGVLVLLCRWQWIWKFLGWEKWYVSYNYQSQRTGCPECGRDLSH